MNDLKPEVEIIDQDGNAFSILAKCQSAARRAAWDERYLEEFLDEATAGDYNHLLRTVMDYFTIV
tara:strand:- start:167 stop:361 length:195 start_codon:yes stop_codon:yes gene_type:complete